MGNSTYLWVGALALIVVFLVSSRTMNQRTYLRLVTIIFGGLFLGIVFFMGAISNSFGDPMWWLCLVAVLILILALEVVNRRTSK